MTPDPAGALPDQALPPAGCPWPAAAESAADLARPADVVVHAIALRQPPGVVARLVQLLDAEERERAARFHGDELRDRFVVAHGALRELLGAQAGIDPRAPRFDSSGARHGKPRLVPPLPGCPLSFNLSHSGALALLAISGGAEVGVDVEAIRPLPELWSVARIVFTEPELHALAGQPPERLTEAFYWTWARKEAALKAIGKGFGIDARSVELLAPDYLPVATTGAFADEVRDRTWSVEHWEPAPGHVGALAVLAPEARTRLFRWPRSAEFAAPGKHE